jgi:putative peptidoglycan lipid II flippase
MSDPTPNPQSSTRLHSALNRGLASRLLSGFVWVTVLTLFGKGVSFFKDAVVARWFGTSDEMDAFVLAFGFLGFAASVLGGGLPEAFLPHYAELKLRRGSYRAQRLAVQVVAGQVIILILIAGLLWLGAGQVMEITARSFSPEKKALAAELLRRLLPFFLCYGLSFQLSMWLRADKAFAVAAAAPMIIPVTVLLAMMGGASMDALVSGTLWGSGMQLLLLGVILFRQLPRQPRWQRHSLRLWEPALGRTFRDSLPYLMSGLVYSSATIIDQTMAAALLPAGAVSILSYSDKVVGILLAMTASPAGEVLFPYFAESVARKDWTGLKTQLTRAVLIVGGVSIPATGLLMLLAQQTVSHLFERGAFTAEDTVRVAAVVRIAICQVPFYILGTLCSRVVISLQAPRFILFMSVFSMVANAGLNWVFVRQLGAPGIALSTVLVVVMNSAMVMLYVLARIRALQPPSRLTRIMQ